MTLPTYNTCTVGVANGGTTVTGVGTVWSGVNVREGDFFARADGIIHPTNEIRDVKFFSYDEYQKQLEKAQVMNVIFAQLKNTGLI